MNEQILRQDNYYSSVCDDRYSELNELILLYGNDVINLAYSYVKDRMQAEDIAQEAFIKAFTHLDQFHQQSSLKTWIYRITINCAKDYLRSSFFRRFFPSDEPLAKAQGHFSSSAEEEVFAALEKKVIWNAVFQLPLKYREVILLFYREGFAISDIAEILTIGESSVRTRLRRARAMLEQTIGGEVKQHGSV